VESFCKCANDPMDRALQRWLPNGSIAGLADWQFLVTDETPWMDSIHSFIHLIQLFVPANDYRPALACVVRMQAFENSCR